MTALAIGVRYSAELEHAADFDGFRDCVRRLWLAGVAPRDVAWTVGPPADGLFEAAPSASSLNAPGAQEAPRVPKAFVDLSRLVICHKAPDRFALAHRILVRLQDERTLLKVATDPDIARAETMAKNVRRCSHKMKAFVRFRSTADPDGGERFVAWFEPEHHTLDLTAGFFERRFAGMRWSILTPDRSAHWDGAHLTMAGGASKDVAPDGDSNEDLWRTYFGAIFNPARLKVQTMQSEMPKRYWKNMPEAALIQPLIRSATQSTGEMIAAKPRAPARSTRVARERQAEERAIQGLSGRIASLEDLAMAAGHCERCPLHGPATQTVLGEGPPNAPLMFVGEQPGDQEDIAGRPFVGPAGQLFDEALEAAGIERDKIFVTNAVKHFKFAPRGKRRIHQKPGLNEIDHCRFWLQEERRLVRPQLTVALGATAARSLSGRAVTISKARGSVLNWPDGGSGFITVHPSYLLRLPTAEARDSEVKRFVDDLTVIKQAVWG
ncbi:MAG: UdgX family uracil-DNA binding protein [Pseudomonadota bacterium]